MSFHLKWTNLTDRWRFTSIINYQLSIKKSELLIVVGLCDKT